MNCFNVLQICLYATPWRRVMEWINSSIILDFGSRWDWSASLSDRFSPEGRVPSNHWTGGWVIPNADLDARKENNLWPLMGMEPLPSSQSVTAILTELSAPGLKMYYFVLEKYMR